jgi:hypothetical protein
MHIATTDTGHMYLYQDSARFHVRDFKIPDLQRLMIAGQNSSFVGGHNVFLLDCGSEQILLPD